MLRDFSRCLAKFADFSQGNAGIFWQKLDWKIYTSGFCSNLLTGFSLRWTLLLQGNSYYHLICCSCLEDCSTIVRSPPLKTPPVRMSRWRGIWGVASVTLFRLTFRQTPLAALLLRSCEAKNRHETIFAACFCLFGCAFSNNLGAQPY